MRKLKEPVKRDSGYPKEGLEALANLLIKLRGQKSLREFSDEIGISHNTIRLLETGQINNPDFKNLERIAEFANITVESVFSLLAQSEEKNRQSEEPTSQQVIFWAMALSYRDKLRVLQALANSVVDTYPEKYCG